MFIRTSNKTITNSVMATLDTNNNKLKTAHCHFIVISNMQSKNVHTLDA